MSIFQARELIMGLCALNVEISLKTSSSGFWFLIIFLEMGSSFRLKLAVFSLSLVMHKSISPVFLDQICWLLAENF